MRPGRVWRQTRPGPVRVTRDRPVPPSIESKKPVFADRATLIRSSSSTIRPGATMGDVFDAHAAVLDDAGYRDIRLNACGYGMGAVYAPIWVDWPMLYHGNPLTFAADQVYFLHMILLDLDAHRAMTLGHSVRVTDTGVERLSRSPLDLVVC